MTLKQKIQSDLKSAMKSDDTLKRDALRMLDCAIKNMEIEKKKKEQGLSDAEVQGVVARLIKQREDAAEQYKIGGRLELAKKEKKEAEILSTYRPRQMGEEEIRAEVKKIIVDLSATSKAEMGQVMGSTMGKLKGKADGGLVKKIVEEELK